MNHPYRLRLLGPLLLGGDDAPLPVPGSRKAQALLGYLARQNQPVTRSTLVGMFWSETSDTRARHNLTRELSQLTARLPGCFQADYHTVQWAPADPACIDLADCAAYLAGNPSQPASTPINERRTLAETPRASDIWFARASADTRAPACLDAAVALYRGEFLAGLYLDGCPEFETWLVREREYWRRQVTDALEALIAYYALRHADAQAQAYARRWLEIEPWQEDAHCYLLVLLARNGQRRTALAQYDTCRHALESELGVKPAPETVALYEQIRSDEFDKPAARRALPGRIVSRALPIAPSADYSQSSGATPEIGACYGRESELCILERWMSADCCRLVALVGMGGSGKTVVAARLANILAAQFAHVFWCSLLNAPLLSSVLRACLQLLSGQKLLTLPDLLDDQLTLLIDNLRRQRCLIVLDSLNSLFQPGDRAAHYLPGYDVYGQFIERLGRDTHQSCILLTSREQPLELESLVGPAVAVRMFLLPGLASAGNTLLAQYNLCGPADAWSRLIDCYSGNPLALKLAGATIADLFGGDINAFLRYETPIFDTIRDVLDQQFASLPELERDIILCLAIAREPLTTALLSHRLAHMAARRQVLEGVRSLLRRFLLEVHDAGVTLPQLVMAYAIDYFTQQIEDEIVNERLDYALRHSLLTIHMQAYARQVQLRPIFQPIIERLIARLGRERLVVTLEHLLASLHGTMPRAADYAASNILCFAAHLNDSVRSVGE